ncbi:MAG TPA: response regulator [Candidatus Dormibacteraeota bacterium]|jgi:CheY-like chemotaxis protein
MIASGQPRFHRALILDDEAERRAMMREALLDHGVACDEAGTVEGTIRRLSAADYDLVVCDMVLSDPPGAANPALRGYLAVCFALSCMPPPVVVQASSLRRLAHVGSVLTNWSAGEVVDLVYGGAGIPISQSDDGGCPWAALRLAAASAPDRRRAAVCELLELPIVRDLEGCDELGPALGALEDAAFGEGDWAVALARVRRAMFPGASDDH